MSERRVMPPQRPHSSKQDYGTPREFIDAVEARFGPIILDLAASAENHKSSCGLYFTEAEDYLSQDFSEGTGLPDDALCWCNPPFGKIAKFAKKIVADSERGARILFLVPASVGANWYWEHIHGKALVLHVGRMRFDGAHLKACADDACVGCAFASYPKDMMLCAFGPGWPADVRRWQWRPPRARKAKRVA